MIRFASVSRSLGFSSFKSVRGRATCAGAGLITCTCFAVNLNERRAQDFMTTHEFS